MSGENLRTLLQTCDLSLSEISKRMGKSQQAFQNILKAEDVKSGTLEKLCSVLGVDMSFFYPSSNAGHIMSVSAAENSTQTIGSNNNVNTDSDLSIKALYEMNTRLMDILEKQMLSSGNIK